MGIFQRLGTLIKSNINDLISKAEDPEKMLSQVLVEMKNQLVEAKKQVAVAIGDEKRLKKQWEDQGVQAKEWERKAMLAERLRVAYSTGEQSLIETVLSSDSFADAIADIGYFLDIGDQDKALAKQVEAELQRAKRAAETEAATPLTDPDAAPS